MSYLIFTDMDGTLLDHHNYSYEAALPVLRKLRASLTPVIPNTSKTFSELQYLREEINLDGPFIVENGAAVYMPMDTFPLQPDGTVQSDHFWVKEFTVPRSEWLELLTELAGDYPDQFTHFAKMTTQDIVAATGLTPVQAERAASRGYGEPVLWLGSDDAKQRFIDAVSEAGATPLMGGRFLHVSGATDKGHAMRWLVSEYIHQYPGQQFKSIALGDGQNDAAMLEAADYAVRITSPVNPLPELTKTENVITSTLDGPAGWAECIEVLITNNER